MADPNSWCSAECKALVPLGVRVDCPRSLRRVLYRRLVSAAPEDRVVLNAARAILVSLHHLQAVLRDGGGGGGPFSSCLGIRKRRR